MQRTRPCFLCFRAGITFNGKVQLLAFCLFEVCVGVFWPSMMTMRAQYVPEDMRATIINLFRSPTDFPMTCASFCRDTLRKRGRKVSSSQCTPEVVDCCIFMLQMGSRVT